MGDIKVLELHIVEMVWNLNLVHVNWKKKFIKLN